MQLIKKHRMFKSQPVQAAVHTVIIHHTAGGNLKGAEDTLIKRGLGYHYMIDKDGTVIEYEPPTRRLAHAYANNTGTVGVSYVGGGKYGPINHVQYQQLIELLAYLRDTYGLKNITGHKHADPRGWKIDPRWPGEPEDGIDLDIDRRYMLELESKLGMKAILTRKK